MLLFNELVYNKLISYLKLQLIFLCIYFPQLYLFYTPFIPIEEKQFIINVFSGFLLNKCSKATNC